MSCLKWPLGPGRNPNKSVVKLPEHKITMLGDESVGKTALVIQFCLQHFAETYPPIMESSYRKSAPVDEVACILDILDTAGQEEHTHLHDQWISKGEAIILVYSIDSRSSFHKITSFHRQIIRVQERLGVWTPICLVGNKSDRVTEREVSIAEGSGLALDLGIEFFVECSAKDCVNVEKAFYDPIRALRAQQTRSSELYEREQLIVTSSEKESSAEIDGLSKSPVRAAETNKLRRGPRAPRRWRQCQRLTEKIWQSITRRLNTGPLNGGQPTTQ